VALAEGPMAGLQSRAMVVVDAGFARQPHAADLVRQRSLWGASRTAVRRVGGEQPGCENGTGARQARNSE